MSHIFSLFYRNATALYAKGICHPWTRAVFSVLVRFEPFHAISTPSDDLAAAAQRRTMANQANDLVTTTALTTSHRFELLSEQDVHPKTRF